ncbi:MAG: InlB B-repeat-containing protein [Paludibacteraceae bacterium]|nr:InlB B-repeat-containing protein [Paludibacteraceae bacterium]
MKRFSIFCAALFAAATSFAAVTYELNGGVTNDDNWLNKNDMFQACMADCGVTGLATLDELKAAGDGSFTTICGKLTDVSGMLSAEKWDWLEAYIMNVQNNDPTVGQSGGATALVEGTTSAGWRYAVAAFFLESKRASWPVSADFSQAGKDEAYIPAWKHAFANPTEITEGEFVLNAPYKEGYTFAGWCTNAELTGAKVKVLTPETTGTLYAKWIDYVPTIAEVKAMADDTETQVSGVVTFIQGKNVYIQDATGGMLLYMKENPTFTASQKVIVKGTKVLYGGAPEVKSCVEVDVEDATLPAPINFENLTALVSDTEFKYFGQLVTVPGLVITEYDSYNNPTVSDGMNSVKCYKMVLDPAAFPVGCKVTITAVAAYYNAFQFVGDVAGIIRPIAGKKDTYAYPQRHGKYNLENQWVISVVEENYAANKPGGTGFVRGMAAKDGIMYFINRETESIVRVDGATGDMLEPIKITGENLFLVENEDGTWGDGVTLKYNDIKFDSEGNCLISGCITSQNQHFMVYVVDLETGAAELLIDEKLGDNPDYAEIACRFDAFGVNGDVYGNACIMAADATGTFNSYRWLIEDGEVGQGEMISLLIDAESDKSHLINAQGELVGGWGTAPQIFPQDEYGALFYVDGFNTLPTLIDEGGMLVEDFIKCPAGTALWNNPGDTTKLHQGLNGLQEFQVGDEYFMVMIATHTPSAPPSAFGLYKFADEARSFDGLEPLWYFPNNGLGSATNGCRTAVPSVEVDGNTATIYLYANDNGYGVYKFIVDPDYVGPETGVENVEVELGARKMIENGQVIILKNGVKYNVLGAEVK